jgi:hypothetical protein
MPSRRAGLLADGSLIVQRKAGIVAEPPLASPGRRGVAVLAEGSRVLVVGSRTGGGRGAGRVRGALAADPPVPTVFVGRGARPGGLARVETRTPFGCRRRAPEADDGDGPHARLPAFTGDHRVL